MVNRRVCQISIKYGGLNQTLRFSTHPARRSSQQTATRIPSRARRRPTIHCSNRTLASRLAKYADGEYRIRCWLRSRVNTDERVDIRVGSVNRRAQSITSNQCSGERRPIAFAGENPTCTKNHILTFWTFTIEKSERRKKTLFTSPKLKKKDSIRMKTAVVVRPLRKSSVVLAFFTFLYLTIAKHSFRKRDCLLCTNTCRP